MIWNQHPPEGRPHTRGDKAEYADADLHASLCKYLPEHRPTARCRSQLGDERVDGDARDEDERDDGDQHPLNDRDVMFARPRAPTGRRRAG